MNKIIKILIVLCFCFSQLTFGEEVSDTKKNEHDYLYSQEYFDYLIECASIEHFEKEEEQKALKKIEEKQLKKQKKDDETEEINPFIEENTLIGEVIKDKYEPFKLHIESFESGNKYRETFKKENSKITIPINNKFSYMTDTVKTRSKYNSQDYKILAGAEYTLFDFLSLSGGLETNYRGLDQNPNSRKLYITPKFSLSDKLSITFPNKFNIHSHTTDHDIGINLSPFKSKFMDFGVYGGLTRTSSGSITESINFSTNLYFF